MKQAGFIPILIIMLLAAAALGGFLIYQQSNWKTYTNTKDGYSIQYPVNLKVEFDVDYPTEVTFYFPQYQNREFFDYIMIGVTTIPTGITIPQAIQKGYSAVGSYRETEFENMIIDGINGLANQAPAVLDAYDIHLIKDYKLFAFRVSATDVSKSSEQRKIFEKMLSTFKFLP